jgi:hypothetical protein
MSDPVKNIINNYIKPMSEILEIYKKLNDQCNKVLQKIKDRNQYERP